MKIKLNIHIVAFIFSLLFSIQAYAHHGYPQYDMGGEGVSLRGTIQTYRLANPHSYITMSVANENGVEEIWVIETAPTLRGMRSRGFTPNTLNAGDMATIIASPAKNGDLTAVFRSLELADGTVLPDPNNN